MATVTRALSIKFQSVKDSDVETTELRPGDTVTLMKEWDAYYLIRDDAGHYYNVPKDAIQP